MFGDCVYWNKYKYILSGIDVVLRFKVVRFLWIKKVFDVVEVIEDIYKVGVLIWFEIVMMDVGIEFLGDVIRLFIKYGVKIDRSVIKYYYWYMVFVENFNK